MTNIYEKRFTELETQIIEIESTKEQQYSQFSGSYIDIDSNLLLNWLVKAKSLLTNVCGENSQHFISFLNAEKPRSYEHNLDVLHRVKAVFLAAKEDFEGGYLNAFRSVIQAELFDDELEQASELLASGYTLAAAVIAGVVLETNIRNLCVEENIPVGKLDKMNADLAKSGIYNVLTQKKVTALAAIRNSAAHGNPADFSNDDVKNMIEGVRHFIEKHLG